MQKITKTASPPALAQWQQRHPGEGYKDLTEVERRTIRKECLGEQKGLCAFCCCSVTVDSGHNAHILSQTRYPQQSLEWTNLVASCMADEHCGRYQGSKIMPLTPLMPECETELQFYASGKVKALTLRAQKTIEALNLDSPILRYQRKSALEFLVYSSEFHHVEDIPTWDAQLIDAFIAECSKQVDGILLPYAPVLSIGQLTSAA